jgi:hypothetical protein
LGRFGVLRDLNSRLSLLDSRLNSDISRNRGDEDYGYSDRRSLVQGGLAAPASRPFHMGATKGRRPLVCATL